MLLVYLQLAQLLRTACGTWTQTESPMHSKIIMSVYVINRTSIQSGSIRGIAHVGIINKIIITVCCVIMYSMWCSETLLSFIARSSPDQLLVFTFSLCIWFFSDAIIWETEPSCVFWLDLNASYQGCDWSQVELEMQRIQNNQENDRYH